MKSSTVILLSLLVSAIIFLYTLTNIYYPAAKLQSEQTSVCEVPTDLSDSIGWLTSVAIKFIYGTTVTCKKPLYVKAFADHRPPVVMTFNGTTRMEELRRVALPNVSCKYASIHYAGDNRVQMSSNIKAEDIWKDLPQVLTRDELPVKGDDDETRFAYVRCWQKNEKTKEASVVFEDFFIFMPSLAKFEQMKKLKLAKTKQEDQAQFSVLILVLESTSRANFHRSMPETEKALNEIGGQVTYLKGLTRIGDNTFSNMLSFTTGLLSTDSGVENKSDMDFNKLPFLWKGFEEAGYASAFIDDNPFGERSMLSYGRSKGFTRPPTTFFPQPFWTVAGRSASVDCVLNQSRPRTAELLGQTERFIRHVQDYSDVQLPFFVLSMLIRSFHVGWSGASRVDAFYADFLRRLGTNVLKDTVLILAGDHGDRFSAESNLLENGHVEVNLPLMALRLPDKLLRLRPQWGEMLLRNERRLTSNLDIHRTLLEMLKKVGGGKRVEEVQIGTPFTNNSHSAYSLVSQEVPPNRTCEEASIPELFCVCQASQRIELPLNNISSSLSDLILAFTEQLNALLPAKKCQRLSLHRVLSVATFPQKTPSLINSLRWMMGVTKEVVEFTLEMAPSGAVLRTKMTRSGASGLWSAVKRDHEIERLNAYGNQSHCLEDRILRKYCLCLDVKGVLTVERLQNNSYFLTKHDKNMTFENK